MLTNVRYIFIKFPICASENFRRSAGFHPEELLLLKNFMNSIFYLRCFTLNSNSSTVNGRQWQEPNDLNIQPVTVKKLKSIIYLFAWDFAEMGSYSFNPYAWLREHSAKWTTGLQKYFSWKREGQVILACMSGQGAHSVTSKMWPGSHLYSNIESPSFLVIPLSNIGMRHRADFYPLLLGTIMNRIIYH